MVRSNPSASTVVPTEEQEQSTDEKEDKSECAEQLAIHLNPALPLLPLP